MLKSIRKRVNRMEGRALSILDGLITTSVTIRRHVMDWCYLDKKGLGDQIMRASASICSNMAEGWDRTENIRNGFLHIALGSLELRFAFGPGSVILRTTQPHALDSCGLLSGRDRLFSSWTHGLIPSSCGLLSGRDRLF